MTTQLYYSVSPDFVLWGGLPATIKGKLTVDRHLVGGTIELRVGVVNKPAVVQSQAAPVV